MSWKASVSDSGREADLFTVGDDFALVSEGGLHCLDARTGKRRGVNEQVISAVVSDGRGCSRWTTPIAKRPGSSPSTSPRGLSGPRSPRFATSTRWRGSWERSAVRWSWKARHVTAGSASPSIPGPARRCGAVRCPSRATRDITITPVGSSFIRSEGEHVSLIDARDGTTRWTTKIPKKKSGGLSPGARHSFSADHLFIGTWELLALRLSDGELAWSFGKGRKFGASYEPGAQHYGPPVVKDGVVYTMERLNGLVAVDAGSGRLLWEGRGTLWSTTSRPLRP